MFSLCACAIGYSEPIAAGKVVRQDQLQHSRPPGVRVMREQAGERKLIVVVVLHPDHHAFVVIRRSTEELVLAKGEELFTEQSWLQVMVGQGILPRRHHPLADSLPREKLEEFLGSIRALVRGAVEQMSTHDRFVAQHCAAASG
jgi:Tryptophan halogenase